jgi:hypothetical protein
MDYGAKIGGMNCGDLGIPEITDKDCKAVIREH